MSGILGVGTDIVSVERIRRALARHGERFARRILHPDEWQAFAGAADGAAFLAKRFAAKEAAVKAMGVGFRNGLALGDIRIHSDALGKPLLDFDGRAREIATELGVGDGFISLADEREYAVAFVTLCRR